jgi:nucleoside 2-deoxyribosyltransferase
MKNSIMHYQDNNRCFVIMPFADEFNHIWEAIQEVGTKECHLTVNRADSHTKQSDLIGNVFSHLNDCDLVVIDITGSNLKVIFEFGYAVAQNKYIIPITQGKVRDLPSDLRAYLFLTYHNDQIDEFKINLRKRFREELERIMNDRVRDALETRNIIVDDVFDVECISSRDKAKLDTVFSKAKKEIKVLQTNMFTVVENYCRYIQTALDANPDLVVNFLALDPESYFAAVRAKQLGIDVSEFRNELRNALLSLHAAFNHEDRVEIRIYDDFQAQICFIIDGTIYNCVVSKFQSSRKTVCLN